MRATTGKERTAGSRTTLISSLADLVALTAEARLIRSPHIELRRVSCAFREGVLTLRGSVSCHDVKRIAADSVRHLCGVAEISNQLTIAAFPSRRAVRHRGSSRG